MVIILGYFFVFSQITCCVYLLKDPYQSEMLLMSTSNFRFYGEHNYAISSLFPCVQISEGMQIIFFLFLHENIFCGYSLAVLKLNVEHSSWLCAVFQPESTDVFLISPQKNMLWYSLEALCQGNYFVSRFYGPVNPLGSCREQSVYLTTLLLGRHSLLSR